MRIYLKRFLPLLFFAVISVKETYAEFQQELVDNALRMTSTNHNSGVHPAVKVACFLDHELALTSDPVKAKNIADTILGLISKGQGVGGVSARQANPVEADLLVQALSTATDYLVKEEGLTQGQLTGKIGQIATEIDQPTQPDNDVTKAHFAQVSTVLFAAYAKHADNITNPSLIKPTLRGTIDASSWLKVYVDDDRYWEHVQNCLDFNLGGQQYNVRLKKRVDALRSVEEEQDKAIGINPSHYAPLVVQLAKDKNTLLEIWEAITERLQTTLIPEKAEYLSKTIRDTFKSSQGVFSVDFKQHLDTPGSLSHILKALIMAEAYRRNETGQGTENPSILDYQGTNQDAKSEAILLALVSAIQNYLSNPTATPANLIELFTFEKNSHDLAPPVQAATQQLIRTGEIAGIINDDLLEMIDEIHLSIHVVQKLAIDEAALKQLLVFAIVPQFDFSSPADARPRMVPKFMRFIRSYGNGQCGYYSLRLPNGKPEYVNTIIDNSQDPVIAGKISALLGNGPKIYTTLTNTKNLIDHVKKIIVGFNSAADGLVDTDATLKGGLRRAAQTLTETVVPLFEQFDKADVKGKVAVCEGLIPLLNDLEIVHGELANLFRKYEPNRKELEETKKDLEAIKKRLKTEYDAKFKAPISQSKETVALPEQSLQAEIEALQTELAANATDLTANAKDLGEAVAYMSKIATSYKSLRLSVENLGTAAYIFGEFSQQSEEITPILEEVEDINSAYEQDLTDKGIPEVVANGSEAAELKRIIKETFDDRKKPLYDQLSSLIVLASPVDDVKHTIDTIETNGWLDIGAKHDWRAQQLTFPHLISLLKGYDIYVWVKEGSMPLAPAIVSDGEYKLVTFISNRKDNPSLKPRRIHLYNSDGRVHFDKWVEDDNYPDLADALRHKQKYHLSDTRPTAAPIVAKTPFSISSYRFGSKFSMFGSTVFQ